LVFFWIPPHIWSLALHIKKDYTKASIPMLPVISSEKESVQIIAATTFMMVLFSIIPFIFLNQFGLIYLGAATIFGIAITLLSFWLLVNPSEKSSWILFKFTSPYLAILFVAFMIDALFF
jgi:protoheme IX farnesyltransferase